MKQFVTEVELCLLKFANRYVLSIQSFKILPTSNILGNLPDVCLWAAQEGARREMLKLKNGWQIINKYVC